MAEMKLVPADVAVEAITPSNIAYMQRHGDLHGWCERIKASIRPSLEAALTPREEAPAVEGRIEAVARAIDPDSWAHIDACHAAMETCGDEELKSLRKVIEKRLDSSGSISAAERVLAILAERAPSISTESRGGASDLVEIIRTRLLGVAPDDQDVVLEDADWRLIINALEASK